MPSSKERARWERWYEQVDERMRRQKAALDRMGLAMIEATAALSEIAAMDEPVGMEDDNRGPLAKQRAQEALDRMQRMAAANNQDQAESDDAAVIDPRRPGPGGNTP